MRPLARVRFSRVSLAGRDDFIHHLRYAALLETRHCAQAVATHQAPRNQSGATLLFEDSNE
jgi:hypothetical protein